MKTVMRLMDGTEKTPEDCHNIGLWLGEEGKFTNIMLADGEKVFWPTEWIQDDASDSEVLDFYCELHKKGGSNEV